MPIASCQGNKTMQNRPANVGFLELSRKIEDQMRAEFIETFEMVRELIKVHTFDLQVSSKRPPKRWAPKCACSLIPAAIKGRDLADIGWILEFLVIFRFLFLCSHSISLCRVLLDVSTAHYITAPFANANSLIFCQFCEFLSCFDRFSAAGEKSKSE